MTNAADVSRRLALQFGGAAAMSVTTVAFAQTGESIAPQTGNPDRSEFQPPNFFPHAEWEFALRIAWDGRHPSGVFTGGQRIYNVATGGEFVGPRLRGRVVPGGGDWAFLNPPTASLAGTAASEKLFTFDARYILQTSDGAYIYVTNRGCKIVVPADKSAANKPRRIVRAITTPVFDTPLDSRYVFLSQHVYVAMSESRPADTLMHVFRMTN